jgi:GNAT superfamily N-acetyltransferase
MPPAILLRHPLPHEYPSAQALVTIVATETFADLFAPRPVPLNFDHDDWSRAWIAIHNSQMAGLAMTNKEWVSDLWVLADHRRQGIGAKLMVQCESEIAARGHRVCRLRVVKSNTVAVRFYLHQDWQIAREFNHESYHHPMLELVKPKFALNGSL